jgi:hypothetical protein
MDVGRTLVIQASEVFDKTVLTQAEASRTIRRRVIVFDFCSDVAMDLQIALRQTAVPGT